MNNPAAWSIAGIPGKFIGLAKFDQAFNLIECFHNLFVIQLPGKSGEIV